MKSKQVQANSKKQLGTKMSQNRMVSQEEGNHLVFTSSKVCKHLLCQLSKKTPCKQPTWQAQPAIGHCGCNTNQAIHINNTWKQSQSQKAELHNLLPTMKEMVKQ